MFKDKLYNIEKDLSTYNRTRSEMMECCVRKRLDSALHSYVEDLDKSYGYLTRRVDTRVMSKINKG